MNTPVIPNHKIIIFIVFVCCAIMTSLFVYHASQKTKTPILSPDIGMIFPVARDIKSFELVNTNTQQKFSEKDFYQHWTLLFFGFTHCASVCPATLDVLKRVYPSLKASYPNLRVVLVSIDPDRDSAEKLLAYTKGYNRDFIGITGKIEEIRKLQSQLGIYSARDNSSGNYQIQHTASIMLINPKGKWAGLYKFGVKPDDLMKGIEMGMTHG